MYFFTKAPRLHNLQKHTIMYSICELGNVILARYVAWKDCETITSKKKSHFPSQLGEDLEALFKLARNLFLFGNLMAKC